MERHLGTIGYNPSILYKIASRRGHRNQLNMYWWHSRNVGINFGDWIGPYIFEKLVGKRPKRVRPIRAGVETSYFSAGSILQHIKVEDSAIVWGSGAISSDIQFQKPLKTLAVRGPKTRDVFLRHGYPCPTVYGDPGLLMPYFFRPELRAKKYRLGVVPHYVDQEMARKIFSRNSDVLIIDVKRGVESVISEIILCEHIVSTSLHGLIMAHAYEVPAIWGVLTGNLAGGEFKFDDYHLGAGFDFCPKGVDLFNCRSVDNLVALANEAPRFSGHSIQRELLKCCPFAPSEPLSEGGKDKASQIQGLGE